ncbi:MAG: hypothetical protein ACYC64_01210 [Armatimonadota bacterium]
MQLGIGAKGLGDGKQSPIIVIVAIVVILAAGFMIYRNFVGSNASSEFTGSPPNMPPMPGMPGGPQGGAPPMPPGPGGPGGPVGPPPSAAVPSTPAQPAQSTAPAAPAAQPAPSAPATHGPSQPTQAAKEIRMNTMKVFGSVTVSYPDGWKISAARGNTSALFTNGTASFEVLSPDMKANSAKTIAQAALKTIGSGGSITGQGANKLNGSDVYWIGLTRGGEKLRIVGVDAATRVVLVMRAPSGKFAGYADIFNKMQSGMSFGR